MHALKNLELAHYVDRLQDENDELRKLMGWLSGHEPQLRMMIEVFKRQDGEGLGENKVGEGSGENIPKPPKTHHKKDFPPKPNHLRNRLDTTPAPPVFPIPTNDLQKPIKFVSTSGEVFFGKESEKASEEKPMKLSGEKPSEQPQPKPKPKLVRFHCGYCGKEGHKDEFCFKRKCEERMAKEWENKDRYNPSHGVPKPRMPLPRGKDMVRSVPAWGDASSRSRGAVLERAVRPAWLGGQTGPAQRGAVRPAWQGGSTGPSQNSRRSGFRGGESRGFSSRGSVAGGWSGESAVVNFLGIPPSSSLRGWEES
jgi:hypothetical protein